MKETIVLYAAPGIGHIVSMVELANHLLHLPPPHSLSNYSITILLTTGLLDHPSIDAYIRRISSSNPSISFLRLPPIPVPADDSISFPARAFLFVRSNVSNVAAALRRISESSTIKAFVIDLFCTTAMETASSMGIPVYYFFTSGAAILAFFTYFPKIHEQSKESFRDMAGVELHVPGNSPLLATHVPEPMLVREDPAYWEMLYFCENLPKAKGILVNTFTELEPRAVKAVTEGVCFPDPQRAPPVYYIGPFVAEPQQSDSDAGRNNKEYLKWLDSQPSRSVLFLCFGSRGTFSVSQLKDIAQGLEKSKQRFLWVVKTPTPDERTKQIRHTTDKEPDFDLGSVLPNGFIERTKDRGLVVKLWAPQVEVLSHDSVGGFVTHCGWNSVLESVVAGVPMIAWPLYAEQHANRHVMVDDMKVAVAVEQREPDGYVSEEEVEKRVRELMESEKGKELRETSLKMKQFAVNAVSEFGSSSKALANFVQTWIGITNGERI